MAVRIAGEANMFSKSKVDDDEVCLGFLARVQNLHQDTDELLFGEFT
jgi:hypothetical protein